MQGSSKLHSCLAALTVWLLLVSNTALVYDHNMHGVHGCVETSPFTSDCVENMLSSCACMQHSDEVQVATSMCPAGVIVNSPFL